MNSISYTPVLMDIIAQNAQDEADSIACSFQPRGPETASHLSYKVLLEKVEVRAKLLTLLGYSNKRVALLFPSGLEFIVDFLACLRAGVIAIPLNVSRNAKQFERTLTILKDAKVKAILTTADTQKSLSNQLTESQGGHESDFIWIDEHYRTLEDIDIPAVTSNQIAFIQYTSGSTSRPKGVMVTQGNIVHNMQVMQQSCQHPRGAVVGGWLPQFHDMGLVGHMLLPLYLAGRYVFMPPMSFIQRPSRWLKLISQYRIFCSAAPNFGYEHCVNLIRETEDLSDLDLSCWKIALNGSEPVSAATMQQFSQRFYHLGFDSNAFFPSYGMAETTLFVSGGPRGTGVQSITLDKALFELGRVETKADGVKVVCCGAINNDFTVRIVNPDTFEICRSNETGEIWIAGDSVAAGYLNQPAKTEDEFYAKLSNGDPQTFLRTGDMGFILEQQLYITGRIKELLIVRGRNIYPYDIERTCRSYRYAAKGNGAAVFSFQRNSQTKLAAVVEVSRQALADNKLNRMIDDLKAMVTEEHEITLDRILVVPAGTIPKTTSGKVKRTACSALL
ncbi:fatty acyl-AMP ligase [Shewanella sp. KX20019]|uniref:fatty acyl-AMP ligase n=1 Tax=Shewanella sp. KX20019 TaxID=2803864 RepID=UPI0019291C9F|nr:fatty acyl-AMP ligase [Shewanella sp. KX20019]QQX80332.1 fatty acyl-AMP ligase [Shewanella sp. KX20019]